MENSVRIVIADDHPIFRDGVRRFLEMEAGFGVVGVASDGEEALDLVRSLHPDVLVFDMNMPRRNGVELVTALRELNVVCKTIVLTALEDEKSLSSILFLGIDGFLVKTSGVEQLVDAIRSVMSGVPYVAPDIAGRLLSGYGQRKEQDRMILLSEREKETLYWLSQGASSEEIAEKMFISDKTARNHIAHILKKLGVSDRSQAIVYAWKTGFASQPPKTK